MTADGNHDEEERSDLVVDDAAQDPEPERLPTFEITSYGADYPVDSLVQRVNSGDIAIPPFQRGFVWTPRQCSRFIESLLLGLPVPGIFLYRESDSNKLMVIDGQQRLRTLSAFYSGVLGDRAFKLPERSPKKRIPEIHPRFEGKTYKTLLDEDRRRLNDSIIHAIIVRQEKPAEDLSSVYYLFERINSTGTSLDPQEIRTAVFSGPLVDLVQQLADDEVWREIWGPRSRRRKDEELLLRFFALFSSLDDYFRPMKDFLNWFTAEYRFSTAERLDEWRNLFTGALYLLFRAVGPQAFRPEGSFNAAVFDGIAVGLARALDSGSSLASDESHVRQTYLDLLRHDDFKAAYTRATADQQSVRSRIGLAEDAFKGG